MSDKTHPPSRRVILLVGVSFSLVVLVVLGFFLWRYATTERPSPDRVLIIQSTSGQVEFMENGKPVARAPAPGSAWPFGAEIRTGPTGTVVLASDDGTLAVILPNSTFRLVALRGTPANPLTRLQTNGGEISVFRFGGPVLPEGAGFEIQTPGGTLAIRGSSMGVRYPSAAGSTALVCLTGSCESAGAGGQAITLSGGQQTEIDSAGLAAPAADLSEEELQRQLDALTAVEEAGVETLSVDISGCSNDLGGRVDIAAGREYIAVTRPGCWPTPEDALANKNSVSVGLTVDGADAAFVGYGPTAECMLPEDRGTYNFGAYFLVGPFPGGEHFVGAVHNHTSGYVNEEACVLQVR